MGQRGKEKPKRAPVRAKSGAAERGDAVQHLEAQAKALERERDALRAELEAAQARIALLEQSGNQVVSRINWVIESLNTLSGKGA